MNANVIDSFEGENDFLSNFYTEPVYFEGEFYASNEHAYQAAKATNSTDHEYVRSANTPGIAKKRGREIKCRSDWELVKVSIMTVIVRNKFMRNVDLAQKLLDTYPKNLVEGNWWHDTFWGVCDGIGQNHLGKILMQIRDELRGN